MLLFSERFNRRTGGRAPVVVLLLCALAGQLAAQAATCPARLTPARLLAPGFYVSPEAAALIDGDLMILGWPRYSLDGWKDGAPVMSKARFAGLLAGEGNTSSTVREPMQAPLMLDAPRLTALAAGGARVTFVGSSEYEPGVGLRDTVELWTGRYSASGWHALEKLAEVSPRSSLGRQMGSPLVPFDDGHVMAFGSAPTAILAPVTFMWQRGDSSRLEVVDFGMEAVDYVDVATYRDELWIAIVGRRAIAGLGELDLPQSGIFVARLEGAQWTRPRLLVVREAVAHHQPRLIPTAEGLQLAWTESHADTKLLSWRAVETQGEAPAVHLLRFAGPMAARGEPPFEQLFSAAVDDSTAKVWHLGAQGATEIAAIPTVAGVPPLVVGAQGSPIAIGVVLENTASEPVPRMALYDLRCGLAELSSTHERPNPSP